MKMKFTCINREKVMSEKSCWCLVSSVHVKRSLDMSSYFCRSVAFFDQVSVLKLKLSVSTLNNAKSGTGYYSDLNSVTLVEKQVHLNCL